MNSMNIVMQLDYLKEVVDQKSIVLFGAGDAAKAVIQLCDLLNLECLFMVDNDSAKWNRTFIDRYEIKPPHELLNYRHDIIILVASTYYDEICGQLKEMGFVEHTDFINAVEIHAIDKGLRIFSNEYTTFQDAQKDSTGYEVNEYREAALKNILDYRNQLNIDTKSLLLDEQQFLLAVSLATQVLSDHADLSVLDFGGALGEHYFLVEKYLTRVQIKNWTVCETNMIATLGNELHNLTNIKFISDIRTVVNDQFDLVIASGSLQFVDSPEEYYRKLSELNSNYVFITRFPILDVDHDILTKLTVPSHLFKASYPSWIFSTLNWVHKFQENFDIIASWENHEVYYYNGRKISFQGFLLKHKCQSSVKMRP